MIAKNVPKTSRTKSVLITGNSGFTGVFLSQKLKAAGHRVIEMSLNVGERSSSVDITNFDSVREFISGKDIDAVIHLAAISFVAHDNPDEIYDVNIKGSRNLLATLAEQTQKPEAVILASTSNVYGRTKGLKITEAQKIQPANDYAVSKAAMEHIAGIWSEVLPITITRPFNYTGVGQSSRFLIPKIVDHFKRGESQIVLGNIDVQRDFLDVRDVAQIYLDLIENPAPGEVFNVASGVALSISEIIQTMNEIAGYEIEVISSAELQRASEIPFLSGDSTKLWKHLGTQHSRPFVETLTWMFEN